MLAKNATHKYAESTVDNVFCLRLTPSTMVHSCPDLDVTACLPGHVFRRHDLTRQPQSFEGAGIHIDKRRWRQLVGLAPSTVELVWLRPQF